MYACGRFEEKIGRFSSQPNVAMRIKYVGLAANGMKMQFVSRIRLYRPALNFETQAALVRLPPPRAAEFAANRPAFYPALFSGDFKERRYAVGQKGSIDIRRPFIPVFSHFQRSTARAV